MYRRSILWLALVTLLPWQTASAGEVVEFTAQQAEYRFGESLSFWAEFTSTAVILEGYVFFESGENERTWVYEGNIDGSTLAVHVALGAANQPRADAEIRYWFRLGSDHGEFFESPYYSLLYEDNRFAWQQIEAPPFTLRWYNGDAAFAEAILSAARQGAARLQTMLPLPAAQPMTLRAYDNAADLQTAAQLAGYTWAAGHTQPGAGLLMFVLPPDNANSLEIERRVPHEVAHMLLFQAFGESGYANLPAWLDEGIASYVETYSDPQREQLLAAANASGALLPFYSLCQAFPQDQTLARLAYAQSASFVRYLRERFNQTGFAILVDAYAKSGDCLNATQPAFGVNLHQLEADWRTASFQTPGPLAGLDWRPIAAAACFALLVWGVSRLAAKRWG